VALPGRDHRLSLADAAALTKAHRDANPTAVKAGAIARDQVLQLLNQSGCVGMRGYRGRNPYGTSALVMTGICASDNELTKGMILEQLWMCPPVCGATNPLNF
jgi:hypothetical protein